MFSSPAPVSQAFTYALLIDTQTRDGKKWQGILTKVESPSVIDFIKCGNMAGATLRYRELHNCKTKAAYDAVFAMKRDMRRISKKGNKKEG